MAPAQGSALLVRTGRQEGPGPLMTSWLLTHPHSWESGSPGEGPLTHAASLQLRHPDFKTPARPPVSPILVPESTSRGAPNDRKGRAKRRGPGACDSLPRRVQKEYFTAGCQVRGVEAAHDQAGCGCILPVSEGGVGVSGAWTTCSLTVRGTSGPLLSGALHTLPSRLLVLRRALFTDLFPGEGA